MKVTKGAIECRNQKDYHLEGNTEHEGKSGAYKQQRITENTATIVVTEPLMEKVLGHQNLMRALRFVKFADDTVIFVKIPKADRVSEGITKFIEEKLKLKVNKAKTNIRKAN